LGSRAHGSCVCLTVVCSRYLFFFSSRRRHTRSKRDWSSDVCSSDLSHDFAHTKSFPSRNSPLPSPYHSPLVSSRSSPAPRSELSPLSRGVLFALTARVQVGRSTRLVSAKRTRARHCNGQAPRTTGRP